MIALLLVASLALNIWYLVSFRLLMTKLETNATPYWESIGRPNSFSGKHVSDMLSNLYRKNMTSASIDAHILSLLKAVRMLLPVTSAVTGCTLYLLVEFLNQGT
jgi:hypothetical protein